MKKLRLFAGPNGSGKTTIFEEISNQYNCGHFVNADQIEAKLRSANAFSLNEFGLTIIPASFREQIATSNFFKNDADKSYIVNNVEIINNQISLLHFDDQYSAALTYFAAFLADYCRNSLLDVGMTFSAETVMSHPSKLDFMRLAQSKGFAVYLYFITTQDVRINIERVKDRVTSGGHNVPEILIRKRYERSLKILPKALKYCKKAFIIDTTNRKRSVIAELSNKKLNITHRTVPEWFDQYVLSQLPPDIE